MVEIDPDSIKNRLRNHTPPSTTFNELEDKPKRRSRKLSASSDDKTPKKTPRKTKKTAEASTTEIKKTPNNTQTSKKSMTSPIVLDSPSNEKIEENTESFTEIIPPEPVIIKRTLSSTEFDKNGNETSNDNLNENNATPKRKRGRPKSSDVTTPTKTSFKTPAPQFDTKRIKVGTPTHTSVTTPVIKKSGNSEIIFLNNNFHEQNTPSKSTPSKSTPNKTPKLNSLSSNLAHKAISELAKSKTTEVIEIDSSSVTEEKEEIETPTKKRSTTSLKKVLSEETPSKKTPTKESFIEVEMKSEKTPSKDIKIEKDQFEKTPSEKISSKESPSKKTPSKKTP